MKTRLSRRIALDLLVLLFLPAFVVAALLPGRRTLFVWGSTPLKCNRYWAEAVRGSGRDTMTIMGGLYGINQRADFDRFFEDFAPRFLPGPLRFALGGCLALIFILRRTTVLHTSYWGFALTLSSFWKLESWLFRMARIRTVIIPFGGDAYLPSQIIDPSLRHGLLASYPDLGRQETQTARRIAHWNRRADIVIPGFLVDGMSRSDVTICQTFVADTDFWGVDQDRVRHDGRSGPVKVLHTPNHRGFKGTEFVAAAVETLQREGLDIELILLEKVPNQQVPQVMREVDILAEQFIFTGYAMSGIEGMASGLPVMANLEHEAYTRVFRRYSFLDECPILSTSPETLVDNLRLLVTNPGLRAQLGAAGRAYAEKYHSYAAAQYLFSSIYKRILDGEEIDLLNLYHPITSGSARTRPKVSHPLVAGHLPAGGADPLRKHHDG